MSSIVHAESPPHAIAPVRVTRRARASSAVVAAAVISLPCAAALAQEKNIFHETPDSFVLQMVAVPIGITRVRSIDFGGLWRVVGEIGITDAWDDTVEFNGRAWHVIAPHGEPPNPNFYSFYWFANADVLPNGMTENFRTSSLPHAPHHDNYIGWERVVRTGGTFGSDDIEGYALTIIGLHDCFAIPTTHRCGLVRVSGNTLEQGGQAAMVSDSQTGEYLLRVIAPNLAPHELVASRVRVGLPGQSGAVIVDLGSGWEWADAGEGALIRTIDGGVLPPQYLPALLASNASIELDTLQPGGRRSGRLEVVTPAGCLADLDHNGAVQPADVAVAVSTWFSSLSMGTLDGDYDQDGFVRAADVAYIVGVWFDAITNGC